MSLDVYLELFGARVQSGSGIFVRENGATREITRAEWDEKNPGREPVVVVRDDEGDEVEPDREPYIYHANITHNLGAMAEEAEIDKPLWRPEEIGITHAGQLIEPLGDGLARMKADPTRFKRLNPSNGWGSYETLVDFVERYLAACKAHPLAQVSVWR